MLDDLPIERAFPESTNFSIACHVSGYRRESSKSITGYFAKLSTPEAQLRRTKFQHRTFPLPLGWRMVVLFFPAF